VGELDLSNAGFFEKFLFKNEPIEGQFKLQLVLTDLDIANRFEQVLLEVLKGVAGIGVMAISSAFAAFGTGFLLDKLFDDMETQSKGEVTRIGECELTLDADEVVSETMTLVLQAPNDIDLYFFSNGAKQKLRVGRGKAVALVTLKLTVS
jgi:hypothetical protein